MPSINRRLFLAETGAAVLTGLAPRRIHAADSPNEKINIAVMGLRGRGQLLATLFAGFKDARVSAICDVDDRLLPAAVQSVESRQGIAPRTVTDVRRVLDDKSIDALVCAAPNHWHALATVWACQAGKDVYVEKPLAHNIIEGRRMIQAARKYDRVVQVGTQRRSSPHWRQATQLVRDGKIGHVGTARAWVIRRRKPIGRPANEAVPPGVDYNLWLGPAAQRPFNPNHFHYNWNWFWDYGGGELANNGVHLLDMARCGMGVDSPQTVNSAGGKFVFDDDQQTPDTQVVTFEFPRQILIWEHRQWSGYGLLNEEGNVRIGGGVVFYGSDGTLFVNDQGWQIVVAGEIVERGPGADESQSLLRNFLDCVKNRRRPDADVETGHLSTVLCHVGNISHRLGRKLTWDGKKEEFSGDTDAGQLLGREYRAPFVVPAHV
jgi:predicted dehydrogenase